MKIPITDILFRRTDASRYGSIQPCRHFAVRFLIDTPKNIPYYFGLRAGQTKLQGIQFGGVGLLYPRRSNLHNLCVAEFAIHDVVNFSLYFAIAVFYSHTEIFSLFVIKWLS